MLHITFMGGNEVRVKEEDNIVITICGATEILLPTIAEKIVSLNRAKKSGGQFEVGRRTHAITLMGATVTIAPTLGREIKEMIQLRESNLFTDEELGELWREVVQIGNPDLFEYFTVMGGAGDEFPTEDQEITDLRELQLMGIITQEEMDEFEGMIKYERYSGRKVPAMEKFRELLLPPRPLAQPSRERLLANSRLTE